MSSLTEGWTEISSQRRWDRLLAEVGAAFELLPAADTASILSFADNCTIHASFDLDGIDHVMSSMRDCELDGETRLVPLFETLGRELRSTDRSRNLQ